MQPNDDAYSIRDHIAGGDAYPDRWAEDARQFREIEVAVGRARLNTAYGTHERERFDLFYPAGRPEGLVVFVHGGYWRLFDRTDWSHFARGCTARGWAVAMPSYPLAPEVGIDAIALSVRAALMHAAGMVQGPIALTGHSAGGHLVARMACADANLPADVAARIRSIVPISPVSDLRPLLQTSMNADFGLDAASAVAESPALQPKALDAPVSVWVGADERPVFLDQARWLAEAWNDALTIVPERHHFDVIDALEEAESDLVGTILGERP